MTASAAPASFLLSAMASPVEIVDQVIAQAIILHASDILFEPAEHEVVVRLRVDGMLQTLGSLSPGAYDQVLTRIKVLGGMDVTENRKPQECKIRMEIESHPYVLRAAVVSTNFGQMVALRVLDLPLYTDFGQLGIGPEITEKIKADVTGRYGLFLVCGPTGSGKTTTVHTCLKYLNSGETNIMTIEDPIEYVMPGLNQIEVGPEIGLDFASGLRLMLRLNPDVVFVGEIRDPETAKIAVQASLTGHLVISTIHARNSIGALYRLIDLGVDRVLLNYAIRGIVSQRLMRRVCPNCQEFYTPSAAEIAFYQRESGRLPQQLVHGRGCDQCRGSRYKGRIGIFELLDFDDQTRSLVESGAGEAEFHAQLMGRGFVPMNRDGIKLVDEGVASLREFIRVMYDAR